MIKVFPGANPPECPFPEPAGATQGVNMLRQNRWLVFYARPCAAAADADVLYLRNGDRVSGTLVGLGEATVRFQGVYTAEFSVPWSEVLALTTDAEVDLVLRDSGAVSGRLILLDDKQGLAFSEVRQLAHDDIVTIAVPGLAMAAEAEAAAEPAPAEAAPRQNGRARSRRAPRGTKARPMPSTR